MKKWIKTLLKTLGVIGILIVAVIIYSVSFIDTTPYFETGYYAKTIKELNNNISNRVKASGELKAGFAQINITPKIVQGTENPERGEFNSVKLAGFSDGKFATGVHDSLFANAVAIEVNGDTRVLVSADILLIPPEIADIVDKYFGEDATPRRKQIIFGATHAHTSIGNSMPGLLGKQFGGEYNPELVKWLAKKFIKLINNAVADIKPASFSNGYIHVPGLVKNRMSGKTGRLNDKLTVLSFKQESGKNAVIGIFAAHATSLGSGTDLFSGDYPGYFQRALENSGVDMAMFFSGTVGSHTNKGKGKGYEKPKYIGTALADSAKKVLNGMVYSNIAEFSGVTVELETPEPQMLYISDNLRLSPAIGKKLLGNTGHKYLQGFRLNNFVWISSPCEFSGEYAIDLKNALELKGFNSAITGFNGQYLGYVVPGKYYYYDSYESRLMGWYGPVMGDYIMELDYTLAKGLTGVRL